MQTIAEFKLERYFGRYEFAVQWLLSPSDCESMTVPELLQLADPASQQLWQELALGYTESPGHPQLRAAIADLYHQIAAEQVVVAAPEELILIAMQSLLQPGDHIIYTAPAYQSLYEVARSLGCTVTPWHLQPTGDQWTVDIDQLAGMINQRTKLLVINFPHNPTGYLPPRALLDAIIDVARAHRLYLFSDEMYRLLEHDATQRLPALCDLYERAITLSGMSKAFGLPGLRIGWLATQVPELPMRWLTLKDYTTICNSAPSEILALIGLRASAQLLQRNLTIVQENLRTFEAFCQRHADQIRWLKPQAGSTVFPGWRGAEPLDDLCTRALAEQGLMIVPGSLFDWAAPHFRVGLGRRNLPQVLAPFDQLLAQK
ncbi:MAG: aminotransferase class I/II-fold pyridoxal phosphate-dependent enzyme [Caldilineaceae bacterium]|nr:aminotransferase class I/II-fold pyridoxal phosphate-dependent enzyme [Caldilineaceae bacterium]